LFYKDLFDFFLSSTFCENDKDFNFGWNFKEKNVIFRYLHLKKRLVNFTSKITLWQCRCFIFPRQKKGRKYLNEESFSVKNVQSSINLLILKKNVIFSFVKIYYRFIKKRKICRVSAKRLSIYKSIEIFKSTLLNTVP
jgi:hypothetical protein